MYEAIFHINSDGAYEQATAATKTSIEMWCNDHCDLLQIRGTRGDHVLNKVRDSVGIRKQLDRGTEVVLITDDCLKTHLNDNIEQFLSDHGCLLIPPLQYMSGEKRARILALDSTALSAVYQDLSTEFSVRVKTKRSINSITPESPSVTLQSIIPELSPRQRQVFRAAYKHGYYEIPREKSTKEIATIFDISRRTTENHLRLAEKKIVDSIAKYL